MNLLIIGSVLQVHFALGIVQYIEPGLFDLIKFDVSSASAADIFGSQPYYYWRDFTGDRPEDVFVVGNDINGENEYVGNAAFPLHNVLVGKLTDDEVDLISAVAVIKITRFDIKLLCTRSPEFLAWEKVNATTDLAMLKTKHLVRGGLNENGIVYIGRVFTHEGAVQVGSVVQYGEKFCLWFEMNGLATHTKDFEILLWDSTSNNFICD